VGHKNGPFLKFVTRVYNDTEFPHIKLFSSLSAIKMASWILEQLNILCTSLVKPYYTKNNNSVIIYHSHVTASQRYIFSTALGFIKAEW